MMIRLIVKLLRARGLPSARVTALALLVVAGLIIAAAGRLDSAHGASPVPFDSGTTSGSGLVGDANCNGGVDSLDALFILQFSAGLLPSLGCPQNADANGDGAVSSLDAALVLQYAAGLTTSPGGPPTTTTLPTSQDLVDYAHYLYCRYMYGGYGPWAFPICQPGNTDDGTSSCIVDAMLHNFTLEQIATQDLDAIGDYLAADVQSCITRGQPAPLPDPGPGCNPIVGCGTGCDPIVGCGTVGAER